LIKTAGPPARACGICPDGDSDSLWGYGRAGPCGAARARTRVSVTRHPRRERSGPVGHHCSAVRPPRQSRPPQHAPWHVLPGITLGTRRAPVQRRAAAAPRCPVARAARHHGRRGSAVRPPRPVPRNAPWPVPPGASLGAPGARRTCRPAPRLAPVPRRAATAADPMPRDAPWPRAARRLAGRPSGAGAAPCGHRGRPGAPRCPMSRAARRRGSAVRPPRQTRCPRCPAARATRRPRLPRRPTGARRDARGSSGAGATPCSRGPSGAGAAPCGCPPTMPHGPCRPTLPMARAARRHARARRATVQQHRDTGGSPVAPLGPSWPITKTFTFSFLLFRRLNSSIVHYVSHYPCPFRTTNATLPDNSYDVAPCLRVSLDTSRWLRFFKIFVFFYDFYISNFIFYFLFFYYFLLLFFYFFIIFRILIKKNNKNNLKSRILNPTLKIVRRCQPCRKITYFRLHTWDMTYLGFSSISMSTAGTWLFIVRAIIREEVHAWGELGRLAPRHPSGAPPSPCVPPRFSVPTRRCLSPARCLGGLARLMTTRLLTR